MLPSCKRCHGETGLGNGELAKDLTCPFRKFHPAWLDCTTNTSGYDFRKGQVVIGTAFLASPESFAHDYHKQRVIRAQPQDTMLTDIFHINWPIGARARVLQNSVTRGERGEPFGPSRIIGEEEGRPIYLFSTDSPLRSMSGDFEGMALYAGQGVGRINAIVPAGERFAAIVGEAARLLRKPTSALGDSARRTSSAGRPPHGTGQG